MKTLRVHLVTPARNEEHCLPLLLDGINELLGEGSLKLASLLVVDNACIDRTAHTARSRGATVLFEPRRGYGAACLRALSFLSASMKEETGIEDVVVFTDADYSDFPEDLPKLLLPLANGEAEIVIGARVQAASDTQPHFITRVTRYLLRTVFRLRFHRHNADIGRYRAITWRALKHIRMSDRSWGWPLEMQIKALQCNIPYREIPVRHRERPKQRAMRDGGLRKTLQQDGALLRALVVHLLTRSELEQYPQSAWEELRHKANV